MNKFDINTAKFTSIIIGICFIFIMVVWHAYDYIPTKDSNNLSEIQQEQNIENNENLENKEVKNKEENLEDIVEKVQRVDFEKKEIEVTKIHPLETIYENNPDEKTIEKTVINTVKDYSSELANARKFRNDKKYAEAVAEYQNTISNTEDKALQAQCYEEVAIMYATLQKYGSALPVAQKAYNTKPSTSREVLLARLYYKSGNIDKATSRINNILRRDFNINDK